MIYWGPYAVPAWASPTGEISRVIEEHGWDYGFAHDPRAEWYANGMLISGSPTQKHHRAAWGRLSRYDAFGRLFRQGLKEWDPTGLIDSVQASGARYLVVAAKHHDGFLLWPSRKRNPRRRGWQVARDVVGEIARSARDRGMRFGIYYSAGLDWSFGGAPVRSLADLAAAMPRQRSYASYVDAHWHELIARYSPSILWNDGGSPREEDLADLFSTYYQSVPDGVVNDRFAQADPLEERGLGRRALFALARLLHLRARREALQRGADADAVHADFRTVENGAPAPDEEVPWERICGLGPSIGHSTEETEDQLMPVGSLVRQLVDVVAHGGNLLLGIGPRADGSLSEAQLARLSGFGDWLRLNGDAIFGTRPWGEREGTTEDGIEVRFTAKGMTTYAILLGTPAGRNIVLPSLRLLPYAGLRVVGSIGYAAWFQEGKDLHIRLTEPLRESPAHVISITPHPRA